MDTKLLTKKNTGRFLSVFLAMFIPLLLLALPVNFASAASSTSASSVYNPQVSRLVQTATAWEQVNNNGFGDPQIGEVTALEAFNGYLYAGTYNPINPEPLYDGAQIFRSSDGATWNSVTQPGFGNTHDIAPPAILDFVVFNNQLYASTGRGNASQIWRSSNGTTWAPMDVTGFSDPDNVDITALAVYNGKIYAGVRNQVTGAQIWNSFTGNNNEWTQVAPDVPGTIPASVTGFVEFSFDGGLYAAIESEEGPAQIWRSYGGTWEIVVNDGFGNVNTLFTGGMVEFGGDLYAGAGNTTAGAQLWRSTDGDIWTQAIAPGFGDSNNQQVESLYVFQNQLYVSVKNTATGMEIWRTADGTLWEQANLDGFGDSNNTGTNRSNAAANFMGQFYVGTSNIVDGGELWRKLNSNNPPTDILLSNNTVDENQPVNTVVGALSAIDPDAGDTFTFSLACSVPGADDGSFNIQGANLRTSAVFDFATKSIYNICIRVTDQGGLTFDKNFTVNVNNLNEAPTDILLNGGFNKYIGTSRIPRYWKATRFTSKDGKSNIRKEGVASVRIIGSPGVTKILTQTLALSGASGDAFTFSFWSKGKYVPRKGRCRAQVLLFNGKNLVTTKTINCNRGTYGFRKKQLTFTAPSAYNKVKIKFTYAKKSGTVWFDAVGLVK